MELEKYQIQMLITAIFSILKEQKVMYLQYSIHQQCMCIEQRVKYGATKMAELKMTDPLPTHYSTQLVHGLPRSPCPQTYSITSTLLTCGPWTTPLNWSGLWTAPLNVPAPWTTSLTWCMVLYVNHNRLHKQKWGLFCVLTVNFCMAWSMYSII